VPVWGSEFGRITIKILALDREELNLSRRTHLRMLDALATIVQLLDGDTRPEAVAAVKDARHALAASILPAAVFAAASQDYLTSRGYI
jgi:hypothetical protein